jgi:ElaA protein
MPVAGVFPAKELSGSCKATGGSVQRERVVGRTNYGGGVTTTLHSARPTDLAVRLAYQILRLRVDVFVVEQECAYPELDGRDLESDALWVWVQDDEAIGNPVLATLRVLRDPDGRARIGRVATAEHARSNGTASRLMRHALEVVGDGVGITLDAQAHLEGWYGRFGFSRSGEEFIEDDIPHVPMCRPAR